MSAIVVLVLRILLAACLYAFLGWVVYTLWRELQVSNQLISSRQVPAVSLTQVDTDEGGSLEFMTPEVIIGRDAGSDCVLANETVSARHARLSYHHNQWWVEDLQSTNGTFLNDERVDTPTVIISGDDLRCGNVTLLVVISVAQS